jgi:putative flippase GtrA
MNNFSNIYYTMGNAKIASLSVLAGATVSIVLLAVAAVLDNYMDAKVSNMISLLIGMSVNFFLQQMIFVEGHKTDTTQQMIRYAIADILILGSNQLSMNYLIDNEDEYKKYLPENFQEYYNTICRMIVGGIIWILFSFPLRRFWVFKKK